MVNNSFHPHVWFANSGDVFRHNVVGTKYQPIGMPKTWGKEVNANFFADGSGLKFARSLGLDSDSMAGDPQFVDAVKGDYRVKDGSAALKVGFKNFPRWTSLAWRRHDCGRRRERHDCRVLKTSQNRRRRDRLLIPRRPTLRSSHRVGRRLCQFFSGRRETARGRVVAAPRSGASPCPARPPTAIRWTVLSRSSSPATGRFGLIDQRNPPGACGTLTFAVSFLARIIHRI